MIRLTAATTDLLRVTPTSANAVKAMVQFSDKTTTAYTGGNQATSIAAASITTICGTPAASTVRDIDHVTLYCALANTLTVGQTVSGTEYILLAVTMAAGDTLEYTHASGWTLTDSSGQTKFVMPGYLPLSGGTLTGAFAGTTVTLTAASPQLTLGVVNSISGGIKLFGSTSGNVTIAPAAAAGSNVTVTLPATSVTLNDGSALTGTEISLSGGTTQTAFANATVLLTLGGTGATSVVAIPGTLGATSTTSASWTTAGGLGVGKGIISGSTVQIVRATGTATAFFRATNTSGDSYFGADASDGNGVFAAGQGTAYGTLIGYTNNFKIGQPGGNVALTLSVGALNVPGLGAFVASDKYLVIDATGNIHVSAVGPAS